MCPGGYVVNASSEEHRLAVNGMSYSDRGGSNANSAIIVSVTPEDFKADAIRHGVLEDADGKEDVLSGVRFSGTSGGAGMETWKWKDPTAVVW